MCKIYASQPIKNYLYLTRSVRIQGVVRSIRLEHIFWQWLSRIAEEEGLSEAAFISKLYVEVSASCDEEKINFTSVLRCAVLTYLTTKASIPDMGDTL